MALQVEETVVSDTEDILDPAEIRALFKRRTPGEDAAQSGVPFDLITDERSSTAASQPTSTVENAIEEPRPYRFDEFARDAVPATDEPADSTAEVELEVRIELGRARLAEKGVEKLRHGSVVPLDTLAGDPVDIIVNGRLIARGEVLVLNDKFCVRVSEILGPISF